MTQSTNRKTQKDWTQEFVNQVRPGGEFVGVEHAWWYNPLNNKSLRLTWTCIQWLRKYTQYKMHRVELQKPVLPKQMLQLERLFTEPYYFSEKYILVMSETDAVMLQLHGGDLNTYLDNLQDNQ